MKLSFTGWAFVSCALLSLSVGCGQSVTDQSELKIRGGEVVKDTDTSSIRRATIALTTDFVSPEKAGTPSILEQGKSFCSGTIVGVRTIVTAAHCIQALVNNTEKGGFILPKPSDYIVHFDSAVGKDGVFIRAVKVVAHPDWDPSATLSPSPSSKPNDIGVVVLAEDIPDSMVPAKIADTTLKVNGLPAYLAGYGVTKDRNNNDTGVLRTLLAKFTAEKATIARVSHGAWLKGICAGDSGGPAYFNVNGELQLVGAASTGAELPILGCMGSNSNSTDIRYYKDWIASVAQ